MTTMPQTVAAVLLGAVVALGCASSRSGRPDAWNAPLRGALAGSDVLRVHDDETPRVITVEGTAAVERVVDLIQLDAARSGQAFCCTGNVTFTFARSGVHVATLESLYGLGWRWTGGPWEADAVPTTASALALARWLAARGSPVDVEELQLDLEAQQRRIDRERRTTR